MGAKIKSRNCKYCGSTLKIPNWSKQKFCSSSCFGKFNRPKGTPAWNKGLKGTHFSPETEFKKGVTPSNSMVFVSGKVKFRGTQKEYKKLHHKIGKMLGKPNKCESCGKKATGRKMHWANISGKYKETPSDWKRLCAKCHYEFDGHGNRKRRAA